jgi:hypothetical protein
MYWGVVGSSLRVWFSVEDNKGLLRTGLPSGVFNVSIVPEDDSTSTTATVSESAQKPGLYQFDVPGSFLTTHGSGVYAAVIQVTASSPTLNAAKSCPMKVTQADIDELSVVATDTELLRKSITNRMETLPGLPGILTLYDDDDSTPLAEWDLRDSFDGAVLAATGVPAKRSGNKL